MINNGGKRAKNSHKIHVSLRISKKNGEKVIDTLTEYNYSTSDHLTKNTENSDSNELTSQTSSFLTGSKEHVPTEIKTRMKACNYII